LRKREKRRIRVYVLTMAAILTMFITAVVLWTLDLANFIMEPKVTLIEGPGEPIESKLGSALGFIFRLAAAQDALYAYMSLLGDATIIHRIWILRAYYRPWIAINFTHTNPVATIMLTYCVGKIGSAIVLGNFENPAFCRNVQTVTYVMPCVTTAVATSLIGFVTWCAFTLEPTNGVMVGRKSTTTQGERILVLLVESGLLYFIFFAIQVIEDVPQVHGWIESHTGLSFAFTMYSYCSSVIVGIYPTIIVLLAHSRPTTRDGGSAPTSSSRMTRMNVSPHQMSTTFQLGTSDEIELDVVLRAEKEEPVKRASFPTV
ncbi:hypothetical protein B0H16DRAFT_1308587, partial [Mycena metata]